MNYTLDIDHENKIIRYKHEGTLGTAEIGQAWGELLQIEEFTAGKYNLLSDYSNAQFDLSLDDLTAITEHLLQLRPVLEGKKQAFIQDDPMSTALAILFEEEVYKKVGFITRVYTQKEEAIKWLRFDPTA